MITSHIKEVFNENTNNAGSSAKDPAWIEIATYLKRLIGNCIKLGSAMNTEIATAPILNPPLRLRNDGVNEECPKITAKSTIICYR